jgi:hypothetical protein
MSGARSILETDDKCTEVVVTKSEEKRSLG